AFAVAGIVVKELYRRKDFYVLFILTALITLVMGSFKLFNDEKIVRYLKEICLLLIWISSFVIAITTTARQLPAEKELRTIFPLLAKPITRGQLILGKFIGCWLACGVALLLFYVFFGIISGAREHQFPVLSYVQALSLHWTFLAVVVALVLLGSVIFSAVSANSTISFIVVVGILFVARHLNKVALQMSEPGRSILYSIYFAIPHLEFYDVRDLIIHDLPLISWKIVSLAILYGIAYTSFFLVATWLIFRRKSLN
ncbi:MAG: ABC transporter permease subunit, partial [Verrucomicrobiota bacterium]